jgi:hypothetical protein
MRAQTVISQGTPICDGRFHTKAETVTVADIESASPRLSRLEIIAEFHMMNHYRKSGLASRSAVIRQHECDDGTEPIRDL